MNIGRANALLVALAGCLGFLAHANDTNVLIWQADRDRVSADIRGEALWPLLEDIAHQTGWHIFVEPGASQNASVKFRNLPTGEALEKLLGNLNFAFVPQTNGPQELYVFTTTIQKATQRIAPAPRKAAVMRHVANQLLVKLKPGANIDALAKEYGAKVAARNDKLGIYLLQFGDSTATDTALGQLKSSSDVASVEYNYVYDPPPTPQLAAGVSASTPSLSLNPPSSSGHVIVGLIDTPIQSLGSQLNQYVLKPVSVMGDTTTPSATDPTHATAMAQTILDGASAQGANASIQILPVDVFGNNPTATTWSVALGVQAAVDGGATVLNLSLAGTSDSSILSDVVQQAISKGIVVFAAAGNQPVTTPMYPAADPGVIAVAATQNGQLAPYSDYGSFVSIALPGTSLFNEGNQSWVVQGTSPATAYASGIAAGSKSGSDATWAQILSSMQSRFPVPPKGN
ncbi:MAG TPA: S8 family serine peptidase [Candidatus Acidoferrales bacterium]|nr:S8 family serine peptidase [Candidatus Acidoferrales bacterium]